MKTKLTLKVATVLLSLSTLISQLSTGFAQGTAFTYQGRLNDGANPADGIYDLRFAIYDLLSAGTQQGSLLTNSAIAISNGLFTVTLDFGNQFPGANRWLEIAVRTNGGVTFTTLSPRQKLTATPYAITAGNLTGVVPAGGLSGVYSSAVTLNNPANSFAGDGTGLINVNAATLGGLSSSNFWQLSGNTGTTPGTHFLGTTDNQALELRVNSGRGLRLEPNPTSPNLIGGFSGNYASNTVTGAHVGGGGAVSMTNRVLANFGTVAGGQANTASGLAATVGGGANNIASGSRATIGGGENNTASGTTATVSGGYANHATAFRSAVNGGELNTASAASAVVGGGDNNVASAFAATIGGGEFNAANGMHAAIPGGSRNTATNYSFAAGRRAKATNEGTFVWADATGIDFGSTAPNQFLVRADFVGINRATRITGFEYFGIRAPVTNNYGGMYVETAGAGLPFYGYAMEGDVSAYHYVDGLDGDKWKLVNGGLIRVTVETGGQVGIGTTSPTHLLHVAGVARSTQSTWATSSDRRAKQNDATVDGSLARIARLRPVTFDYTPEYAAGRPGYSGRFTGFIAQEVESVFPEMVNTVREPVGDREIADFRLLNAGALTPHLVAAMKELNQRLTDELEQKQTEITELKQRLEKLEQFMNQKNGGAK